MRNLCIIPARGGSKRIPRKNIRDFHGKPIIAYAIQCAQNSNLFDRIIVSTEDSEIAEVATSFGAEVPFYRSQQNADDYSTTSAVLVEVLEALKASNELPHLACCLYPTTPLLLPTDLIAGFELFQTLEADVVMSATAFDFPIQRAFELKDDGQVQLREPQYISARSQDLTKTYHDAGAFYFFQSTQFLELQSLWSGKIAALNLPNQRVQDIDNLSDWELAEYKFQRLLQND
jgi:pseudaminic acid cytidylyltransferase